MPPARWSCAWTAELASLDHLVVAARDLDAGAAWLEERLGVPLSAGGRHTAMGTHNRLLGLGDRCYLELIAVDPAAPPPGRPRWFGLDDPATWTLLAERPRLVHWVARSDDLARDNAGMGDGAGDILAMARGDFRWRIAVRTDGRLPMGGLRPSLIQWDVPIHPADRLPDRGCRLMKLEAFSREPDALRRSIEALGVGRSLAVFPCSGGEAPQLVAYLATPRGLAELD